MSFDEHGLSLDGIILSLSLNTNQEIDDETNEYFTEFQENISLFLTATYIVGEMHKLSKENLSLFNKIYQRNNELLFKDNNMERLSKEDSIETVIEQAYQQMLKEGVQSLRYINEIAKRLASIGQKEDYESGFTNDCDSIKHKIITVSSMNFNEQYKIYFNGVDFINNLLHQEFIEANLEKFAPKDIDNQYYIIKKAINLLFNEVKSNPSRLSEVGMLLQTMNVIGCSYSFCKTYK